jgi:large subunit ribosomal protein L23
MSKNFNQERLLQVLLAPQISEKATYIADKNEQVVFIVTPDATKPEVKAAVEMLFKVEVKSVQIANLKGKVKRFGRMSVVAATWRKAFVCLKPGQEINFAEGGVSLNGTRQSQTDFAGRRAVVKVVNPNLHKGRAARQAGRKPEPRPPVATPTATSPRVTRVVVTSSIIA